MSTLSQSSQRLLEIRGTHCTNSDTCTSDDYVLVLQAGCIEYGHFAIEGRESPEYG